MVLFATAISFSVSHDSSIGIWAGITTLVIAYFKARFVMLDFMELRHAPSSWRLAFEGWFLMVSIVLITVYAMGERHVALSLGT
jgi:hypothetical protein